MSARREEATGGEQWPHCAATGGVCLAYEMGGRLGPGITKNLATFVFTAEQGARLTLQRNRDGFTLQQTGAVRRTAKSTFDLEDLHELQDCFSPRKE